MGVYLPHGFTDLTAQYIVDRYSEVLDDIDQDAYADYVDNLAFIPANTNSFDLAYVPRNLQFFINGIGYEEDVHFIIKGTKITWTFTASAGGFDLEPYWNYVALYDVYKEDNPNVDLKAVAKSQQP
jgi:hypothetical protein